MALSEAAEGPALGPTRTEWLVIRARRDPSALACSRNPVDGNWLQRSAGFCDRDDEDTSSTSWRKCPFGERSRYRDKRPKAWPHSDRLVRQREFALVDFPQGY